MNMVEAFSMFKRPHHLRIHSVLKSMNGELLESTECYFAGGTAIVLALGEYRESVDIDFLCESADGYRALRTIIFESGLAGIFNTPPNLLREVRMDQYGIRAVLQVDGFPIKFEIVNEGRIKIDGGIDPALGVPILARMDMYAEKLLANADRYLDVGVASRDIIDLAMMIDGWGAIPTQAWNKARDAYGDTIDKAFNGAIKKICERGYLVACVKKMNMEEAFVDRVLNVFVAS
jgi:hypothetical protein